MREKRKGEHERHDCDVVNLEVSEIFPDPGQGIGERFRSSHGTPIDELRPWTTL